MNKSSVIKLKEKINNADAIIIGAGAGLSTSAGFIYTGARFSENFADFEKKYNIKDMYSGGFYHFETSEEFWAYWSRYIYINRYNDPPLPVYGNLLKLVKNKNYFVITTNVDHCFQKAGFEKDRLFYTQGDFGLFQCPMPCHKTNYDNEQVIRKMVSEQKEMRVPSELIPRCPKCGREMTLNLRADEHFLEDEGWNRAAERYSRFVEENAGKRTVLLELGVGYNTPGIIKYPFMRIAMQNKQSTYVCINKGEVYIPNEIASRAVGIDGDIGETLEELLAG